MTPTERHNALVTDIVQRLGKETRSHAELAVALESIIVGAMQIQHKVYKYTKPQASDLIEAALYEAIKRFSAL